MAEDLTLGGPPEWKTRATGVPGLKKVYGLEFKAFRPLDAGGPLTVSALKNGQVDRRPTCSPPTRPSRPNDFVVLEDPKSLFAAQNVVPLITKAKATPRSRARSTRSRPSSTPTTLGALVKEVVIDKKDADGGGQGVPHQEQPRLSHRSRSTGSAG